MPSFTSSTLVLGLALVLCVENGLAIPVGQLEERGVVKSQSHASKKSGQSAAQRLHSQDLKAGLSARGVTKTTPKVGQPKTPLQKLKAADLKTSTYRDTAIKNNPAGAYVQQPGGKSVKWDSKGKGDAEHVIEPGAHVKPVMNQMGIGKKDPLFKDVKSALNHKDNLSMLDNKSNIGKAKLSNNPSSNPKSGDAAKDYMKKPDVQDKASKTLGKLVDAGKKHGQPGFGDNVSKLVHKNFPNARELDEDFLEARSFYDFFDLDELD